MARDGREVRGGSAGSGSEGRAEKTPATVGKLTLVSLLPTPVQQPAQQAGGSPGQDRGGSAGSDEHTAAIPGADRGHLGYSSAQLLAVIRQSGIPEAEIDRMVLDAGLATEQVAAIRSGSALALTPEQDASLRASLATVYAPGPGGPGDGAVQDAGSTCGCSGNPSPAPAARTVPAVTGTHTGATEQTAGTTAHTGRVGSGTVTVRQDLRVQVGGATRPPAFAIGYQGPDSQNAHWLQFIWREIIQKDGSNNVTTMPGSITSNVGTYQLTAGGTMTAPGTPGMTNFNTDSLSSTDPFYEANALNNRTADATTIYDHPSAADAYVQRAFANGATEVKSRAHFNTFLVQTDHVTYRTQMNLEWHFASAAATPAPVFSTGTNGAATGLTPDALRDRFHAQFPAFNFIT